MKPLLTAIAIGLTLGIGATTAKAVVLYNGLSTPSLTPEQQGWLYLATSHPPAPLTKATSRGTILDTSGDSRNYAGYFLQTPFKLNRQAGYNINFTVQINSESHKKNNRAGFNIIVMSDRQAGETQPYGIELGFWQNSIWAQKVGFTRGEKVSFNTKASAHTYKLSVIGTQYKLFADRSVTPILQGSLHQYTGFMPSRKYQNPYKVANLIFLGDDTTSAKANVTIIRVEAN